MIDWLTDSADNTIDPQDGDEPIDYWWEDMRPREVHALVIETYERGYARGLREEHAKHESLRMELERLRDEMQVLVLRSE